MAHDGESGQNKAAEDGGTEQQVDGPSREFSIRSKHGVVEKTEVHAWYAYDFANSPYWQVFDLLGKLLLKRLAEFSDFPKNGITAGSYPAVVLWINAAFQVVFLLTFSAFGDFGPYRKRLLMIMTAIGSLGIFLHVFFFSANSWMVAGLLRVIVGQAFILSNVYYNAYLSVLAENHYDVVKEDARGRADKIVQVSDEMSAKGFLVGYSGGVIMQLLVFCLLLGVQCKHPTTDRRLLPGPEPAVEECSEFQQLFWIALSASIVGLWWGGFSIYTFWHLKPRPGPDLPEGAQVYCVGWKQACQALRIICSKRPLLLFMMAYFLWSDALATTMNAAILTLDDTSSSDSNIIFSSILSSILGFLGVLIVLKVQQIFHISNKAMLLFELVVYTIASLAGGAGVVDTMDGYGFYFVMAPTVLLMGTLQANTRSLFSSLVPIGYEASMFAFYMITDKGSSLLGFGIIPLVHSSTGKYTGVFWYTMIAYLVSAGLLWFVDVQQGLVDAGKATKVDRI